MEAQRRFNFDPANQLHNQLDEMLTKTGFGTGDTGKKAGNHAGNIVDVTFPAANTNYSFAHRLKREPTFVFIARIPDTQGASLRFISADATNVTLACNVANTSAKLYVE